MSVPVYAYGFASHALHGVVLPQCCILNPTHIHYCKMSKYFPLGYALLDISLNLTEMLTDLSCLLNTYL